jgi:AraC-like DNA-binding protein
MLRRGQALKLIADAVGYGSEAALARAFKAHCGQTPRVAAGAAARQPDCRPARQSVVQRWQALRSKTHLYVYNFQFNSPIV